MADSDLQARLRADPRIRALVSQQRQGMLDSATLKQYGYDVPEGYRFAFGGRNGYGTLLDNQQSWFEKGYPAMAVGALAGGSILGGLTGPAAASNGMVPTTVAAGSGAAVNMSPAATNGITPLGGLSAADAARRAAEAAAKKGPGGPSGDPTGGLQGFLKDPKTYAGLAGLIASLATRPGSGSGGDGGDPLAQDPQLKALLDMSVNRAQRLDPLHQSITQLAMSRMPTNMQR